MEFSHNPQVRGESSACAPPGAAVTQFKARIWPKDTENDVDRRTFVFGLSAGGIVATTAVAKAISTRGAAPSPPLSSMQNVRDHGAVGDGKVVDDKAFQAAVDALPSEGGQVSIPPGTYLRTAATNTLGKAVAFVGAGRGSTFLKVAHPDNDIFVHSAAESADFRDFTIFDTVQRTGGAYIRLDPGEGKINYSSVIERVRTYGHYIAIDMVRCSDVRIRDCSMIGNAGSFACVLLRNLTNADSGDNSISGCFFSGAGGAGIRQESSGGLRLTDNKFNGLVNGVILSPQALKQSTSILIIQSNSFENASKNNILIDHGAGKTIFTYGIISNNEFGYTPRAISVNSDGKTFYDFIISNNIFAVPKNGIGILLDGGNTFVITNNIFDAIAGDGMSILTTKKELNQTISNNISRNITDK